jgi:hypothetical protein
MDFTVECSPPLPPPPERRELHGVLKRSRASATRSQGRRVNGKRSNKVTTLCTARSVTSAPHMYLEYLES